MKKTIYFLVVAITGLISACSDFLDPEVITNIKEDEIWTFDRTIARANAVYTFLPNGFNKFTSGDTNNPNWAMMSSATDESEHTLETNPVQKFNTGSWTPMDNPDNAWSRCFQGIYTANMYLANSDTSKVMMDHLKYDPTRYAEYRLDIAQIVQSWYEVRFLRAFFYFELIKRYGGVPIITEPVTVQSDFTKFPRNTLSECVNFILNECDTVANHLPAVYSDENDMGKITKGASLALKSRLLLYCASDLFNDPSWAGGYPHPELISLTDDGKSRSDRWREAAEAAAAVMQLMDQGIYGLNEDYPSLFVAPGSYTSKEVILARRLAAQNNFEKNNYPVSYDLGNSGTAPTGNLVDDYEIISGSGSVPFDWNNPDHAASPYRNIKINNIKRNRDPRMGFTVLVDSATFKGQTIEVWNGGKDWRGVPKASRTGYYLRKYVDPNLNLLNNQTSIHSWILIRLGEIYLNYAEAVCEWTKDPNAIVGGVSLTARQAVSKIRNRSVMPSVTAAVGASYDLFMNQVRKERRIELAFEDHRFWDVRRWMIAPEVLGAPVTGVEITKSQEGAYTYKPIVVENRVFEPKMYFYPIPQKELTIAQWEQNPLW